MAGIIPQDSQKEQLRASPSTRVQNLPAPQLDKSFLSTASRGLQAEEQALKKAEAKRKREQADFLEAKARNEFRIKRAESEAKVAVTEGSNTIAAVDEERKSFEQAKESYIQNVGEEFRPAVSMAIDSQKVRMEETFIPKSYNEVKKLQDMTYANDIAGFQDEAIIMSSDAERFELQGLEKVKQSAVKRAMKKYGEDLEALSSEGVKVGDIVEQSVKAITSDTVKKAIQYQAQNGAVTDADNLYKKYKEQMVPADIIKADKALDTARRQMRSDTSMAISTKAVTDFPEDPIAQEAYIRENSPDGATYKEAVTMARTRNEITKAANKIQADKALATTYSTLEKEFIEKRRPISAEFMRNVPPEHKEDVLDYASKRMRGEAIISNRDLLKSLVELRRNDPQKFIDETTDIAKYLNRLSKDDINMIESFRSSALSREESQESRIKNFTEKRFLDLVEDFGKAQRLSTEQVEELNRRVPDWVASLQKQEGITELEMRQKISEHLKDNLKTKYKDRTFWFDREPELTEESVPMVQLPPAHRSWIRAIREKKPDIKDSELREKLLQLDAKLKERGESIMTTPRLTR